MSKIGQNSFRLLKKIKDPKFEIDRLEYYSLSLFLGFRDFQILITDCETSHCVLLEDFAFDPKLKEEDKFETIKYIFDDHHLLMANFWKKVNVIVKNKNYNLTPTALFEERNAARYLSSNALFLPDKDELMLTQHYSQNIINVFSVPKPVVELLTGIYPNRKIQFMHQSSSLINGVLAHNKPNEQTVALYIDRFGLHIIVANDKKLLFYNQYVIKKFSDYGRFIRMVAYSLSINLQETQIMLFGYLGNNTTHFKELGKIMPKLALGSRSENLKFGYVFDELLEHQYFDLFSTDTIRA